MIPWHSCWQLCSQYTVQKTIWCQIIMLLIESHKKYTVILTKSFCTTFCYFLLLLVLVNFSNLLPQVLQQGQKLRIHVCTVFQSNQRPQKSLAEVITCNLSVKTRKQDITIIKKLGWFSSMVSGLMKYNKLKKAAFTSNSSHATCYQ